MLFQLKNQLVQIVQSLHRRLVGGIVGGLQLNMLELELVEVLAHGGELRRLGRVVGGHRLDHGGVQILQCGIEVVPAFPLPGLAL